MYGYLRKDGTPYYIGKGKDGRCLKPHNRRKSRIGIPSDLERIVMLQKNLSEEESFFWEKFYIKMFRRIDLHREEGVLRNLTDGGEGTTGRIVSENTRKKVSESNKKLKGELTSMWGKKRPDIIDLLSKKWKIIFPDGSKKEISNLKSFCKEEGLFYSTMCKIGNGLLKSHRGFSCEKIEE